MTALRRTRVMLQKGVGYRQGHRGSGSPQKLRVSALSIPGRCCCAKFTRRDPGGAGGSVLNLSIRRRSRRDGGSRRGCLRDGSSVSSPRSWSILLPLRPRQGLPPLPCCLEMRVQLCSCSPSPSIPTPHRSQRLPGGATPCSGHGRHGAELPIKVRRQLATSRGAGQPTPLPRWETGGKGVLWGVFLIPVLA